MPTPEGSVKARLVRLFKRNKGTLWYFTPATGGFGKSGVPDYIGIKRAQMFAVECKAPGKKPTALQEETMEAMRQAGCLVWVYDGDEAVYADIEKFITE